MQNWSQYLMVFFAAIITAALDHAFFPSLGGFFHQMNMGLLTALFLIVIVHESIAFSYFALVQLLNPAPFFEVFLSLVIGIATLFVVNQLFVTVFTNKSYYTLIGLCIIGWLQYYILFSLSSWALSHLTDLPTTELRLEWFANTIWALGFSLLLVTSAYMVLAFMNKRFRTYFIVPGR